MVQLDNLLAWRGDVDGLSVRAAADDWYAGLLVRRDGDSRRAATDAGDGFAGLLARHGDVDGLRTRADAGDRDAARDLPLLLAQRGDLDGLRARAGAGDGGAAQELAGLLIWQGRREEAERLRWFGLNPDGSIACT